RDGHGQGEYPGKQKVKTREAAMGKEADAESFSEVVERHQGENAEAPEHKGMRQARQRPLGNDEPLRRHLPEHFADAWANGSQLEVGVRLRCQDRTYRCAELPPK